MRSEKYAGEEKLSFPGKPRERCPACAPRHVSAGVSREHSTCGALTLTLILTLIGRYEDLVPVDTIPDSGFLLRSKVERFKRVPQDRAPETADMDTIQPGQYPYDWNKWGQCLGPVASLGHKDPSKNLPRVCATTEVLHPDRSFRETMNNIRGVDYIGIDRRAWANSKATKFSQGYRFEPDDDEKQAMRDKNHQRLVHVTLPSQLAASPPTTQDEPAGVEEPKKPGWKQYFSTHHQRAYYFNLKTRVSTWHIPVEAETTQAEEEPTDKPQEEEDATESYENDAMALLKRSFSSSTVSNLKPCASNRLLVRYA